MSVGSDVLTIHRLSCAWYSLQVLHGQRPKLVSIEASLMSDPALASDPALLSQVKTEVQRILRAMWHKRDYKRPDAAAAKEWIDNLIRTLVQDKAVA